MVLAAGRRSQSSSFGGAHDGAAASGEQLGRSPRRGGGPAAWAELTAGRRPRASSSGSAHSRAAASGSSSGGARGGTATRSNSRQSTRAGLGRDREQLLGERSELPDFWVAGGTQRRMGLRMGVFVLEPMKTSCFGWSIKRSPCPTFL
jgi:hypothetical protein